MDTWVVWKSRRFLSLSMATIRFCHPWVAGEGVHCWRGCLLNTPESNQTQVWYGWMFPWPFQSSPSKNMVYHHEIPVSYIILSHWCSILPWKNHQPTMEITMKSPWRPHLFPMKDARRQRCIGFAHGQGVLEVLGAASAAAGDHRQRASGLHLEATLRSPRSWEITLVTLDKYVI